MVAASRQNRPHMPKDKCPFCPGKGKLKDYEVLKYDNDFPVLSPDPDAVSGPKTGVYKAAKAYGKCEVILYSSDHKKNLHEMTLEHIEKIVGLWADRNEELSKDKNNKYIFIFENKGEEVGVTMGHPHGQIYAYPFVPLKLRIELDNAGSYHKTHGTCLICDMNKEETKEGSRIIYENAGFLVYLPYFTDYPYGVFISSKEHIKGFSGLDAAGKKDLAEALKITEGTFDRIFNRPFPFMMCVHQCPVNDKTYKDSEKYFHLHIEFYPPLRAKDRIKYYASSESGAWAAANVALVENTAKTMVSSKLKYLSGWDTPRFKKEFNKEFIKTFGGKKDAGIYAAPSRVNIIGEHIDYNGGMVMPAALNLNFYFAIRKRKDKKIIIRGIESPETALYTADIGPLFNKTTLWPNYPAGVLDTLIKKGYKLDSGFEMLFFSEIPAGAGISSSAAFEVGFMTAVSGTFGLNISMKETAILCREAENNFVGVKCGIMDQFASAMSKISNAVLLNCATLDYKYIPIEFGDYRMVITNTNKQRELVSSKYNERLAECSKGLAIMKKKLGIRNLCDMDTKTFEKNKNLIKDPAILKRVKHAVTENERVKNACLAMEKGDLIGLGKILKQSHLSLKNDYEVTGPELDALFEEALNVKGCIGSRMTGAGFGGCTISIVHKDAISDFKSTVGAAYKKRTGLTADFYVSGAGDGARKI
jgi:galactokinase/galactose-1-phosphate uridylyltransferase (family 1)